MKHQVTLSSFENGENAHLKVKRNSRVFNNVIDEKHNGWTLSRCMFVHQSTCTIFTNNELRTIHKYIQILNHYRSTGKYFPCKLICLKSTCNVLSNQRLPLFHRAPPPCSIWAATRLWYSSSDTRGIGASKQTVKILFWMERTDSLLILSEEE